MSDIEAMYDYRAVMRQERLEDSTRGVPLDDCIVLDSGIVVFEAHALHKLVDEVVRGRHAICGQSRNSVCYKIASHGLGLGDVVLKQAVISNERTNPDSTFRHEADFLKKLARLEIPGCPKLIARFIYRGRHYLLLSFVPGEHPDPLHVPLKKSVLQQLFTLFFLMDQAGFIHYDLQARNIVVSPSSAGLIDFEFAGLFNPFSVKEESYLYDYNISSNPHMPLRSCVCNFEFRTLYPYLVLLRSSSSSHTVMAFVRTYLVCKAAYHRRMGRYFASVAGACEAGAEQFLRACLNIKTLQRAADYDTALDGLYRNPSPDICAMEYLIVKLRFQLFERDFNACRFELTQGFSYARAKARQFAGRARASQDNRAEGYFNACVELLKKLELRATEALEGHC